jgi:hypothetical protein
VEGGRDFEGVVGTDQGEEVMAHVRTRDSHTLVKGLPQGSGSKNEPITEEHAIQWAARCNEEAQRLGIQTRYEVAE